MQKVWSGFWVGGCFGLALAVAAPAGASGAGRERFDRSGSVFDRSEGPTWQRTLPGGWGARHPVRSTGSPHATTGVRDVGGDPEAPEPTAALLFGAGLLA